MAKYTMYTNYLSERDKERLKEELKAGNSVCVSSDCIGHTRAQMVKNQGEQFLESLGCIQDGEDIVGDKFYKLPNHRLVPMPGDEKLADLKAKYNA